MFSKYRFFGQNGPKKHVFKRPRFHETIWANIGTFDTFGTFGNVPCVPKVRKVPKVPTVPKVPKVPKVPNFKKLTNKPEVTCWGKKKSTKSTKFQKVGK